MLLCINEMSHFILEQTNTKHALSPSLLSAQLPSHDEMARAPIVFEHLEIEDRKVSDKTKRIMFQNLSAPIMLNNQC